ncbi:hypothetical protein OBBRIDRAFT_46559 [Obba rivulosa]|uniref:Uncharacterized protein n=1 Tax=Obba rivulosa TaxID=1052685 RepID=A0A8E2ATG3_9APHY|nr:hypothetical protein OBBRIDRAFT_46559 [Obba rivulosa]
MMAVLQEPTLAHRLRLAIAFTALRHKPPEQSYEAYVLDLQEKFPCTGAQPEPPWRERALELEKKLENLKRKYEEEHIELISLRETRAGPDTAEPASSASTGTTKKKQKKKASQQTQSDAPADPPPRPPTKLTLRAVLLDPKIKSILPQISSNDNVFSSLEALDTLLALHETKRSAVPHVLLLSTSNRALSALDVLIASAISFQSPRAITLLDALNSLVPRFLTSVLPLLTLPANPPAKTHSKQKWKKHKAPEDCRSVVGEAERVADELLGRIVARILAPLVHAFASLSMQYLLAVLPASSKASRQPPSSSSTAASSDAGQALDIRPDAYALFTAALDALDACAPAEPHAQARAMRAGLRSVKRVLALEAARELAKLYAEPGDSAAPLDAGRARNTAPRDAAQKHAARIAKLARRDAAWYLCAVLGRVLSPAGDAPSEGGSPGEGSACTQLLDDAVWEVLAGLLRDSKKSAGQFWEAGSEEGEENSDEAGPADSGCARMGEVERGMLLAVLEKAWMH